MRLTELELATLIRESSRERFVEGGFGPHGVTLKDTTQNAWAIERVRQMRGDNCEPWFDDSAFLATHCSK